MKKTLLTAVIAACSLPAFAQSMHFSQYYNAPMLLNPANTALMSDYDYRAGANYRNQWATIPVPYNTGSAWFDCQAFRKFEGTGWLGIGGAFFNDRAGNGNLSLNQFQGFLAYHKILGDYNMLSVGLSAASVQRSVDFTALTFDQQWDGFSFNNTMPNGEKGYVANTNYATFGAGINYAYLGDGAYVKVGASVANINQPKESFYNGTNTIAMRPTINAEGIFVMNDMWTLDPSLYFTTQSGATELVFGSLAKATFNRSTKDGSGGTSVIFGAFYRLNEAAIGAIGMEWNSLQVMASYDVTLSPLAPYTQGYGAAEVSIIYKGLYSSLQFKEHPKMTTNCPRF